MSTRKTFAHEIAARARRIGWPVRQAGSGEWRITRPDKVVVQVHLTPSDVNHEHAVMRLLNECGFEDAEAKFLDERKKANAAKNAAAARKAEAEARRLAEQNTSVIRATGGISIEDDDYFLMPHDVMKVRRAVITPELASKILALNPTGEVSEEDKSEYRRNRKITRNAVENWKRTIAAGRWRLTHEGIAISNTLKLLDGQHRLTAVSEGDTAVEFIVFVGVDEATFKVIGQGKKRTAADALSTVGATDTNKLSAAARLIYLYLSPDRNNYRRTTVSNDETVELVMQEGPALLESMNYAQRLLRSLPVIHSAAVAAHFLITKKHGAGNPHVEAFFDGMQTHRRLDDMDPRVKLDQFLTNARAQGKRLANMDQLALIIITWNHIANGREVHNIRYTSKQMTVPDILVVPEDSAAPRSLMLQQARLR